MTGSALRIDLLGEFRVTVGTRPVPDEAWRRRKSAGLVKLLALAPGHRLHREQVMEAFWPDLAPASAAANLRKALHHARRTLDPDDGANLIVSRADVVSLAPDGLFVDADAFEAAATRARRAADPGAYAAAVDLYRGDLLPDDRYEEWAIRRREELRAEFLAILDEAAGLLEGRGDLEAAAATLRRLVAADPLNEQGHARLIRLYALAGRRGEALRQYEELREILDAELGAEPDPEVQRLFEEVRARRTLEPALTAELWERVGDLRVLAGDPVGAVGAFGSALEEVDAAAAASDVVRLRRKTAGAWLMQHDAASAEPHLAAAEKLTRDPAEQARLACLRANQAWERGEIDAAHAFAEQGLRLAQANGDPGDIAAAHETLAVVFHFRGDWREGLRLEIERLDAADDENAQLARVFDIHHCIGQYHLYGDGLSEGVEEYARRTLELAEKAGAVRAQAFAWCLLGETLLLQARWEEAAGCLERSCELHASLGRSSAALPWQRLAELAVCRGEPQNAEQYLRRASAIATVSRMAPHLWGRIHATAAFAALEQDDPGAAVRSVRAAEGAAARYGNCASCSALLNPIAAEAFSALGDPEGARSHAEAASHVAGLFDSSAWRAMAESAAGSLARAEGDTARARERFEAAAGLYAQAGQPYWVERSLGLAATPS